MTLKAVFMQNDPTGYNAIDLRDIYGSLIETPGVVNGLEVTATSPASRTVRIGDGSLFAPHYPDALPDQGLFHAINTSTITYTFPDGATGTQYIVARIGDAGGVEILHQPAETIDTVTLARVNITGGTANISSSDIVPVSADSALIRNSLSPQAIPCTSKTRPTRNLVEGLRIFEKDTGFMRQYKKGNWVYLAGEHYANYKVSEILTQTAAQRRLWRVRQANAVVRAGITQGYVWVEYIGNETYRVPPSGNLKNIEICTIKDPYRPPIATPCTPVAWGRLVYSTVLHTGTIKLNSAASENNFAKGQDFSFGWTTPFRLTT